MPQPPLRKDEVIARSEAQCDRIELALEVARIEWTQGVDTAHTMDCPTCEGRGELDEPSWRDPLPSEEEG